MQPGGIFSPVNSGERTSLACWRSRPAIAAFLLLTCGYQVVWVSASALKHGRRGDCSPENDDTVTFRASFWQL
jgi:hypothetical protein